MDLSTVVVPAWSERVGSAELSYPELTLGDFLDCLVEECAEIIQAAQKCRRFGFTRTFAGYGRNDMFLAAEIGDLRGIVARLPLNESRIQIAADEKIRNIANHKKARLKELADKAEATND